MQKNKWIFAVILLVNFSVKAQVENYRFTNFTNKDGLVDKFIYAAVQDNAGLMWFGTGSGLYRFDGFFFKPFNNSNSVSGKNASNLVRALYAEKKESKIWTAGLNSLQWYLPKTNKYITPNYEKKGINELANNAITVFFRDANSNMWIGTEKGGLFLFNEKDSTAKQFLFSPEIDASENFITGIVQVSPQHLWVTTVFGIYLFNTTNNSFKHYLFSSNNVMDNYFSLPVVDKKYNCLWIPSRGKVVLQFNLTNQNFTSYNIQINGTEMYEPLAIANKSENELWIGSWNFGVFNKTKGTLQITKPDKSTEYGFETNKVQKLFTDNEANVWICSFRGLSMLAWQNQQIRTIPIQDEDKTNLISELVNAIELPSSDDILFTTSFASGIYYYTDSNKTTQIKNKNPFWRTSNFESTHVYSVAKNDDGEIFGITNSGVVKINSNNITTQPIIVKDQFNENVLPGKRILKIGNNEFAVSSSQNSFYFINTQAKTAKKYFFKDINPTLSQTPGNNFWPSLLDSKGNVWFTRMQGVYCYKKQDDKFYHYTATVIPAISQSIEIQEDNNHHYWITTKTNGLYELYFENEKEVVKNYNTSSQIGLTSEYTLRIVKDEQGFLWIGSINGLLKLNPNTKKIETILTKQQGLMYDNTDVPLTMISGNRLVVCNFGGANVINLNQYKTNQLEPQISITSLKIMDKEVLYDCESDSNINLKLAHNENYISIDVAVLSYNNSYQNSIAYKLDGIDKEWHYLTKSNTIALAGLSSGNYKLLIKGANNNNIWGATKMVGFKISPPFYATWWFIGLIILLLATLAYLWNRYKINQTKKEEKLKADFQQQIAATEMKALRAQMNPHFIFNSLNSIQKYILKNEHFEASQYLTKFSRLIRLILDHSNQNTILLSSEIDLLKLYVEMEALRFDNTFNYTITIEECLQTDTVQIPSMLIQPFVENAIWHGLLHKDEKGLLHINFTKTNNNSLKVIIEDNGVGREKAAALKSKQVLKKKSYGMQITEDRIAIINKTFGINASCEIIDLKDNKNNATGTKVIVYIPLQTLNH